MLRRRPPQTGSVAGNDDEPPHKQHTSGKKPKPVGIRVLASTLSAAVVSALNPLSDIRGQAYSEYLTSQVQSLTIGWHIFRTVTEAMFLATYGVAFNTLVVQMFWSISVASVLLYLLRRGTWLRQREGICVLANVTYGLVTVLKILNLLDRLPNENNYMFKHCFLTMADAAFSQTPVHKQYMIQFAEAAIRVVVWRRYNVLADTPTWGVIVISMTWQTCLLTFSSMLQARHVSAFRRLRPVPPAANSNPPSARVSFSAAAAAAVASAASRPASCEIEPAGAQASGSSSSTVTRSSVVVAAASAAAATPSPRVTLRSAKSPRNSIGAAGGATSAAEGASTVTLMPRSSSASAGGVAQKRFMRALRGVARGPSSYVLLSHQRRQAGGAQCASAQFYIPAAHPDMLQGGSWRDRLATAVAEGAPGWQVASLCVRKGSLIVHLDLVYTPKEPGAAAAAAAAAVAAAGSAAAGAGAGDDYFSGVSYSEQPFDVVAGSSPKDILDDYMGGMGAESLLELLGLPPDLPTGPLQPISVQLGDQLRNLPAAAPTGEHTAVAEDTAAAEPPPATSSSGNTTTTAFEAKPDAAAPAPAPVPSPAPAPAPAPSWRRLLLLQPLLTALHPPAELRSREYAAFLSERVGRLHVAYAALICLTAAVLFVVRAAEGINPLTLGLFISAELLTLASHVALGGLASAAWRAARCGVVYAGVAARTLQMAACTCGFLPHVMRDSDCVSGRWIQKVVLITTLQALCMQPPVRTFFLVRAPSVLLCIYVHVFVCRTSAALGTALALHLGWEGLLLIISANFQSRHLQAFRRRYPTQGVKALAGGADEATAAASEQEPLLLLLQSTPPPPCGTSCKESGSSRDTPAAAATATATATTAASDCAVTSAAAPAVPAQDDYGKPASSSYSNPTGAAATTGFAPAAASGDPTDVSLSAPLVAMAPRRAARLQLHFTCAPAVVEELQVVLRHINPAAMSSGVHAAHAVRDITRALVAPASAAAAPPHAPAPFSAELTLVASPADMPGLVHVELWRGRRRVASQPVLLAAAPEAAPLPDGGAAAAASAGMSMLNACAARVSEFDAAAGAAGGGGFPAAASSWLDDVRGYVGGLREQGHSAAADQFLEELGGWLAQSAALERGLTAAAAAAAAGGGSGAPARVANVLYFHGYGSEFMYVKPRRISGPAAETAAAAAAAVDPLHETLRSLLLRQGSMLLAVAVEAGVVALSGHLMATMVGEMGATVVVGLLQDARTPVTQLPLLHAAVKSGDPRMVDMVAEWSTSCGLKDIWAAEAAILAVSLESCASSTLGDNTASLEAAVDSEAGSGAAAAAAARRRSRSTFQPAPGRPTTAPLHALAPSANNDPYNEHGGGGGQGTTHEGHDGGQPASDAIAQLDTAASLDFDFDMALFVDSGADASAAKDPSEDSPFRIIDFRASNRSASNRSAAAAAAAAAASAAGAAAAAAAAACGAEATASGGGVGSSSRSIGDGGGGGGGYGLWGSVGGGGLMDRGVLVLTPLHMALALGDEGRLASHILRSYPEAYELWRSSQLDLGLDSSTSNAAPADAGSDRAERGHNDYPSMALIHGASDGASDGAGAAMLLSPAAAAAGFSSLPGLISRRKATSSEQWRGDGGGGGGDDSDTVSLQSMSLSEVAFFEGIRWVDEDKGAQRSGFKVTRVEGGR